MGVYLYSASWGLFRFETQKSRKQQRLRTVEKQRGKEAEKQGTEQKQKRKKQNSGETKKLRGIKTEAGKSRKAVKQNSRKAKKQGNWGNRNKKEKTCPKCVKKAQSIRPIPTKNRHPLNACFQKLTDVSLCIKAKWQNRDVGRNAAHRRCKEDLHHTKGTEVADLTTTSVESKQVTVWSPKCYGYVAM